MAHRIQIVISCDDPGRVADFWAGALGYVLEPPPIGYDTWEAFADDVGIPEDRRNDLSAVIDPEGVGPRVLFERYDGGAPNQRIHIDVNSVERSLAPDQRRAALDAERHRLEALGARFGREASGMAGETWIEMYDPEGNWFCVQ
jgi:hypothetical protein